jgi:hypothetical protein
VVAIGLVNTIQQLQASGTMHFKPENGDKVPVNTPFPINGTSAPSNSTRTGCTVSMSFDAGSTHSPVKALGPGGPNDYTKWATTCPPMKSGNNELESQLLCHGPGGTGVSYMKHLTHNVTAVASTPISGSTSVGSKTIIPLGPSIIH